MTLDVVKHTRPVNLILNSTELTSFLMQKRRAVLISLSFHFFCHNSVFLPPTNVSAIHLPCQKGNMCSPYFCCLLLPLTSHYVRAQSYRRRAIQCNVFIICRIIDIIIRIPHLLGLSVILREQDNKRQHPIPMQCRDSSLISHFGFATAKIMYSQPSHALR